MRMNKFIKSFTKTIDMLVEKENYPVDYWIERQEDKRVLVYVKERFGIKGSRKIYNFPIIRQVNFPIASVEARRLFYELKEKEIQ